MRAKEFINEDNKARKPMRKTTKNAIPNQTSYDALDNNNNPYLAYRFGIALASSPDPDNLYPKGPIGSDFSTIDYSDADAEIRKGAEKLMGVKPSRSTGKGSEELPNNVINKVSPTAKPKKNKYGV